MVKTALAILALAGPAAAFVPVAAPRASSATALTTAKATLESIGGYSVETGNKPFDPLNICEYADVEEMRASELHNGRVAMLAFVGWFFPQIVGTFPSDDVTSTAPLDAISQAAPEWWAQFILVCGITEANFFRHYKIEKNSYSFFDPFNLMPKDAAAAKDMELKEIKNGRAAMIGFAACLAHDLVPGSVPFWPFSF